MVVRQLDKLILCLGESFKALEPYANNYYFHGTPVEIQGGAILPSVPLNFSPNLLCRDKTGQVMDRTKPVIVADPSFTIALWHGIRNAIARQARINSDEYYDAGYYVERKEPNNDNSDLIYYFGATECAKKFIEQIDHIRIYVCPKVEFLRDVPGLLADGQRCSLEPVKPIGYVIIRNPKEALKEMGICLDSLPPSVDEQSEGYDPNWRNIPGSYTQPIPQH